MKKIIYALTAIFIISIVGCQSNTTQKTSLTDSLALKDSLASLVTIDTTGLHGVWEMTWYYDSTVTHRAIAKYRLAPQVWSHLLLHIKADSLFYIGSLPLSGKQKLSFRSDTLVQNKDWSLIKQKDGILQLLGFDSFGENSVRKKYFYKKNNQWQTVFAKYNKNSSYDRLTPFKTQTIAWFNQKIFAGKYERADTKKQVIFKLNGSLEGIKGFDKYKVRPYFGTRHPHKNLDVVTLFSNHTQFKQYYWQFEGTQLTLIEFVVDKSNDMDFVPGTKKIVLKQLEKY